MHVPRSRPGGPLWALAGTIAAALVALSVVTAQPAAAATLFSDGFEDGDRTGWSTNGGSWSVVTDGSQALRQSSTSSDAKAVAGSSSWTDYAVQARVKPEGFNGTDRYAAVIARAQSSTNYYFLALRNGNRVDLAKRVGGAFTVLATTAVTVSTGTWYTLRLEVFGSQLRGFVNGAPVGSATDGTFSAGKVGVATYYAGARFDDVAVNTEPGPGPTVSPTSPTPSPTGPSPTSSPSPSPTTPPPPPPAGGPVGFASVNAWGQNGTTGGAGGPTVTVSTASAFLSEIAATGPRIIRVQGILSLPAGMHNVSSDKTIIGVGSTSGISGAGLNIGLPLDDNITSPPANAVHNVIIRNLVFQNANDDSVNVQMFSHHVWIDHNEFRPAVDGSLDIKRGSSYMTVSWNRYRGTDKNMLLGHDDSNDAQDIGRLKVTYHHNWFDGSKQRNPRIRFGEPVHVFNNYYLNVTGYGVASQMNAGVVVEGNYFDNVEKPTRYDVGGDPGRIVARSNLVVNSEDPIVTRGTVEEPNRYYSYTLDDPARVPALVSAGAGVGKIGA